ncbi:efflux RND transporter periplasmic adaptor subunit [Acetobacter peroxydans]|jgi:multidrug efflux system membrane fusion protein|uniref:efflux RND transporter periplasmic adaptor subunit n=1 Tax=Acetobacter peroxydans TaxID=104098 RepID=UPI0023568ABD|nr:efflux RND transporter periplasmic adaptor subunit [Acetobacter peroxydans]MCH4144110.1 efflux RND transporter periplasmic adaptor subunit [Acetobacter peroxydans]MCI1394099.1 efflux RND transporter periplasmic adaptor subunit [Acetobacter peroxydans]MCI1410251.1 efflux RND transporter periplasmic adaptor subunit [Acetobacter peroxydans]MCI1439574.1 efflux RND transporter periplasmic adaptor subunit [Acetobacter peroxydans]MCI1565848.1 efflux RND transporter periplasmic adaptor subunit [Ace
MDEHNTAPSSPVSSAQASAPASPPSRRRKLVLTGVGIAVVGILGFAFLRPHGGQNNSRHSQSANEQKQAVAVQVVKSGSMPVVLTELGTVIPITNVTVQTRVDGYLMEVLFTEGQHVHKGDLLAIIDPRPYQVLLEQYEGQLARDQAQLDQARVDNARYQKLIRQDSIDAKTARDQQFMVKQLEGTVKSDQAQVDNEKLQLIYCHITAPVDGRIGIRAVDRGNYVTAGQSGGLAVLTQMQPISVIFTLPQDQLPQVAEELRAHKTLSVEAWNSTNTDKIADGTVSALDSEIDTATGTVRLRAIFPNADEHLFPNQFVNARLLVRTLDNVLLLPATAIQTGPSGLFVYVVKADNTVTVKSMTTGISDGTNTVVKTGLSAGDKVVTDGTDHLREGMPVSIPAATTNGVSP